MRTNGFHRVLAADGFQYIAKDTVVCEGIKPGTPIGSEVFTDRIHRGFGVNQDEC